MSKVKPSYIKKVARDIYNMYTSSITTDFEINKVIFEEVTDGGNKRFRNRVTGELVNIKKKEGRVILSPYRGIKDKRKLKKDVKTFKK